MAQFTCENYMGSCIVMIPVGKRRKLVAKNSVPTSLSSRLVMGRRVEHLQVSDEEAKSADSMKFQYTYT